MMSADLLSLLIEATMASSFAVLLVLAVRRPVRKFAGARIAYGLWCFVPLALAAILLPAREIVVTMKVQPVQIGDVSIGQLTEALVPATDFFSVAVVLAWISGMLACAVLFSRRQKNFLDDLGVLTHKNEKIFSAEKNIQGPSVIGVVAPRIVLPSDFETRYNLEEQQLVLSHENMHLSRGDTRINLIAACLRSIFWFNPLMHWAGARFRFDQELSADALVLSKFPSARKSYADAMLKTQMASAGLPVACHWQAHHPLKERILMLKNPAPGKSSRYIGITFVAALCVCGSVAVWSLQPAKVVAASDKTAFMYEMKMDVDVDGDIKKDIVVREVPGKTAMITQGEGDKQWIFGFVLSPQKNNRVMLDATLKRGNEVVSRPKLLIELGKESGIGVSTSDGSSVFKLNMLVKEWRNAANMNAVKPFQNEEVMHDNLRMFRQMAARREYTRLQSEPDASWRKKLKISFVIDPKKEIGKDEGC